MNGIIIGIDKVNKERIYRVLIFKYENKKWSFKRQKAVEGQLIDVLRKGTINMMNVGLHNRKLKGLTGGLSRFEDTQTRPFVIISELVVSGGNVIGYKVANYEGTVKNITARELLDYCYKVTEVGDIPIQNGIYIRETKDKAAHIRCYPGGEYIKEVIERKRTQNAKPAQVDTANNEKAISKLEELFNEEQIKQLKAGRKSGVNIKIYGNNKLSAEQMKVIREALEEGLDAKVFADPEYSVNAMRILRADMKYGADVSYYLNPEYSVEQLSELGTGIISGVDITKYSDPKLTPEQMAEIRIRLENNIWKEHEVKEDSSWK